MSIEIDLGHNLIDHFEFCDRIKKIIEDSENKNKDTQLEINFDKIEKEKEIVDKNKTKSKYENLTKSELIKLLIEKDKEIEERKNDKIAFNNLREKYNVLANKFNEQCDTINCLVNRNKVLGDCNKKLSDDYNYIERLYNGTREACAKWKNEAIIYQHRLRTYKILDDII